MLLQSEDMVEDDQLEDPTGYGRKVGERLRAIRRQKGLSLQDVGVGLAPGVQGLRARRLRARRARHLGAPPPAAGPLLRRPGRPAAASRGARRPAARSSTSPSVGHDGTVRSPSTSRGSRDLDSPTSQMLVRYLQMIQVQRQDFNGRVLTVRRDDLRAIACILDTSLDQAVDRLDDLGLCLTS